MKNTLLDAGNHNAIALGLRIGGIITGIAISYHLSLWIFSAGLDYIRGANRAKQMELQLRNRTAEN